MSEETKTDEPPAIETTTVKVDGREIDVPKLTADWQGNLVPTTVFKRVSMPGSRSPITVITQSFQWPATAACASCTWACPVGPVRTANRR